MTNDLCLATLTISPIPSGLISVEEDGKVDHAEIRNIVDQKGDIRGGRIMIGDSDLGK